MLSVGATGRGSSVATSCDTVACDTFRTDARIDDGVVEPLSKYYMSACWVNCEEEMQFLYANGVDSWYAHNCPSYRLSLMALRHHY